MNRDALHYVTQTLHRQIAEVCPIDGVSIGNPEDKTTWQIDIKSEATPGQRDKAQKALHDFDWSIIQTQFERTRTALSSSDVTELIRVMSMPSEIVKTIVQSRAVLSALIKIIASMRG